MSGCSRRKRSGVTSSPNSLLQHEAERRSTLMGRQGHNVLQLAQALQQIEPEIDAAEAALQAVQQEALQAGAPREWLQ